MISWKKSLENIERFESLFRATLKCYLSAIASVEKHCYAPKNGLVYEHKKRLAQLRARLASDVNLEALESSAGTLDGELREYNENLEECFRGQAREIKDILATLAEAAAALDRQNRSYSSRYGDFARKLEAVSKLDDLSEIRRRLAAQVSAMETSIAELSRESECSIGQLRAELKSFQDRLEQAELMASRDCLTGVANRRDGERRLMEKIRAGKNFSIMFLDLDRFKALNDRFGHHCGDQILRMFAQRLAGQVREEDVVCRWGGDEFLVILNCSLGDAMRKAKQLSERLGGYYTVTSGGKEIHVVVSSSVGVAEYKPGEPVDELFARADALLYSCKALQTLG